MRWRLRFLEGAARALESEASALVVEKGTLDALYAKIGAQAMEIEMLKSRR